jgi:fermentation-respiration switch protein FrsA (DUF1100 family)
MAVCFVWAGAVGLLWVNETRLVYRASWTRSWATTEAPFNALRFPGAEKRQLEGLTLARVGPAAQAYWILFFHGAGWSIHRRQQRAQLEQLYALGYNVFAAEYRGFGRNDGTPSEAGLYADAGSAYAYLTSTLKVPPGRVILAGRSLGSAVAVELATRVPVAGLVLLSPIDSVPATGARLYPWAPVRLLASNRFDALAKIDRVRAPVLVVHATNDRFVPIEVGRALYARARGAKEMLETSGGHNSAGFAPLSDMADALLRFWPPEATAVD